MSIASAARASAGVCARRGATEGGTMARLTLCKNMKRTRRARSHTSLQAYPFVRRSNDDGVGSASGGAAGGTGPASTTANTGGVEVTPDGGLSAPLLVNRPRVVRALYPAPHPPPDAHHLQLPVWLSRDRHGGRPPRRRRRRFPERGLESCLRVG